MATSHGLPPKAASKDQAKRPASGSSAAKGGQQPKEVKNGSSAGKPGSMKEAISQRMAKLRAMKGKNTAQDPDAMMESAEGTEASPSQADEASEMGKPN